MSQNGNTRPKVELALNESATLQLLKDKPYHGESSFGAYYLYTVSQDGVEKALFSTPELHQKIAEAGLKAGDMFTLDKVAVQNGRKVTARIDLQGVSRGQAASPGNGNGISSEDHLKEVLLQCVKDADSIIKSAGIQVSDELQKLATTLFIARSRVI